MGRSKETVNLPSKPIPKGFNIWVVANHGYVLDWLYHAKSDDGGPVDLDDFWMMIKGSRDTSGGIRPTESRWYLKGLLPYNMAR